MSGAAALDTFNGGVTAGRELCLVVNKLGMLPLPRTVPLPHAEQLLDPDGNLAAGSRCAKIVAQILPCTLREPAHYAAAPGPLRQEIGAREKPRRD